MTERLTILQLAQTPQRRGAEVFAHQLGAALGRRGHEVCLAYLYPHRGEHALPLGPQDRLLGGDPAHVFERTIGFHPGLLHRLRRLLAELRPQVVQVNGARTVKYGAMLRALDHGAGWVLVYRNIGDPRSWLRGPRRKAFYRWMVMPRVDGVVGVSRATLAAVAEVYGGTKPMAAIPRAVDPAALVPMTSSAELRRQAGIGPETPLVLYVGSLTAEKRLDRLLRVGAVVRAAIPDLRVWLVGDGPLREQLRSQISAAGIAESVRLWGVQSDVASFLAAADLLLLTSDTEGIPGVILEAGWLARPAVATRVGGVAEAVEDGVTGRLAAPDDEPALAAAVIELLRDPEARRRLGEAAAQRVREHFTIDAVAERYETFYRQLLARGGGR